MASFLGTWVSCPGCAMISKGRRVVHDGRGGFFSCPSKRNEAKLLQKDRWQCLKNPTATDKSKIHTMAKRQSLRSWRIEEKQHARGATMPDGGVSAVKEGGLRYQVSGLRSHTSKASRSRKRHDDSVCAGMQTVYHARL